MARAKPTTAKPATAQAPAAASRERARKIGAALARALPEPQCELDFANGWQLLVATILSAQSTDRTVNRVAPELFGAYPTPAALAAAPLAEVERLVHATGFFRNKAKAIVEASRALVARHPEEAARCEVPRTLAALCELRGVARKTANLVLGTAYGLPTGFVVDTHVGRVARRLGLTAEAAPEEIEADLCKLFPERDWIAMGHRFVLHGRYQCLAKGPRCASCPLAELCPSAEGEPEGSVAARAKAEGALVGARGETAGGSARS